VRAQLRPAREAVRAGDHELRVGELELRRWVRVIPAHHRARLRIVGALEQRLGLVAKVLQAGVGG
jgi:hypothetical protein